MLHAVLLPALSLADAAYQLRALGTRAPGLLAVLTSKPAATPGLECALGRACTSLLAALRRGSATSGRRARRAGARTRRAGKRCSTGRLRKAVQLDAVR